MKTELYSISKIFTERLLRIPDYQRGYAWTERQLKDYWNDIDQLVEGNNHYFGVLTLESVNEKNYKKWKDDHWIIESKSYEPHYIVDGQQRLTTSIILIQTILETITGNEMLNYTTIDDIKKKFIYESKDNGISRSYIFGYEIDNPSYEFLKRHVFLEESDFQNNTQETIYTNNLEYAKKYFTHKLEKLNKKEVEILYKKITQNLLFNIYSMSEDIDVHVSFETMNNRGKPLSHLELLKNRLIYLSTKISNDSHEKEKLRNSINECWKTIYHQLGRNKDNPLDDDIFLYNHFIIFFADEIKEKFDRPNYRYNNRGFRNHYKEFLLEEKFTIKSVLAEKENSLKLVYLYNYVQSLKNSVETWYEIFNPENSKRNDRIKNLLSKLNKIDISTSSALIMVILQKEPDEEKIIKCLEHIELLLFCVKLLERSYNYLFDSSYLIDLAFELSNNKIDLDKVTSKIVEYRNILLSEKILLEQVSKCLKDGGFYSWSGIRYFLYEYEEYLRIESKNYSEKLIWSDWDDDLRDYKSVEHIYPQRAQHKYWKERFDRYSPNERSLLRHTIGNLVPISIPKNSSLQNKPFPEKVCNEKNNVGYKYGSYSEIELTDEKDWSGKEILIRGVKLIKFMSKRWKINFGTTEDIIKFLKLEFVLNKENLELKNGKIINKK